MCYPKPGPRCSSHAAAKLTHAKRNSKLTPSGFGNEEDRKAYLEAKSDLEKAQEEYDMTPAGMAELRRRAGQYSGNQKAEYELRLERGLALRSAMLTALKAEDEGDIKHDIGEASFRYSLTSFPKKNAIRMRVENNSPEVVTMIEEGQHWGNSLSTEEIESVAWFTSNGAGSVNRHLAGLEDDSPWNYSEELLTNTTKNMDSALSKINREEPVLVYRGISRDVRDELGYKDRPTKEFISEVFPVGGTYQSVAFMSSSLDPGRASGFASSSVTLEILSKKAAPVVNYSAWDITEKEMILPRNQKYKVVSVIKNPKFENRKDRVRDEYLVQLIEED